MACKKGQVHVVELMVLVSIWMLKMGLEWLILSYIVENERILDTLALE